MYVLSTALFVPSHQPSRLRRARSLAYALAVARPLPNGRVVSVWFSSCLRAHGPETGVLAPIVPCGEAAKECSIDRARLRVCVRARAWVCVRVVQCARVRVRVRMFA